MAVILTGENCSVKVGSTATTATLANVKSVKFSGKEQAGIDNFVLGSSAKTKRPSKLPSYGTVTVEYYHDSDTTEHQLLRDSADDASTIYVDVLLSNGDGVTVTGFVQKWELSGIENDSNVTASAEVFINSWTDTNAV